MPAGYDSPGIALRGACPPPGIWKALLGPLQHFRECSSTLYHFQGAPPGMLWPLNWEPSHFLKACRTLDAS